VGKDYSGIILQDRVYSLEDLEGHCKAVLKRKIPEWEKGIFRFILNFIDDKEYIEQNSSGTTGASKTYKLSKKAMIESAKLTADVLNLKFGQKALLCLPIDYIAGKMMVVRAFIAGLNLFWEEPSSMPSLEKYGHISFCAMVPYQVYNSFSKYEFFKNIDNLIIGGAEIRSELFTMFRDVNNKTYETYGMTETCSHIALRQISGSNIEKYFTTLPGIKVESDERNCLIINAPYLDGPIKTNDIVEVISENQFTWKGRFDNLINSGGIKVNPEELEAVISQVIDMDFAIVGLSDEDLGHKIVMVIESEKELEKSDILDLMKDVLPKSQIPRDLFFVNKLPRNKAFKVDRMKVVELIS
jgi:O-succinylbenzoic acid--CoA ligase